MKKCSLIFLALLCAFTSFSQQQTAKELYSAASNARDSSYFLADSLIKSAIEIASSQNDEVILMRAYYLAAKIQTDEGWYEDAEDYFLKTIELSKKLGNEYQQAKCLMRLGDNYSDKGNIDLAVKKVLQGIELAQKIKNDTLEAKGFGGLAEMHRQYDQYELSLKYNRVVIKKAIELNYEYLIGKSFNNLSATLGEIGRNDAAIDTLKKGLSLISDSNLYARAFLNSNLGFCYRNIEQYDLAIKYHRIALKLKRKAKMSQNIGYSLGAIGRAYIGKGNTDSAIYYIQQEYDLAQHYKNPHQIIDGASHLADAYEAANNYKKALEYFSIKKLFEDSIYQADVESKSLLYQQKFSLSQKENEINELKSKQLLEKANNQNLIILLSSLLLISVLLVFLFKMRIKSKEEARKRIELQLKSTQLEVERDKEALKAYTLDLIEKNKAVRELSEKLERKEIELYTLQNSKTEELEKLSDFKILTEDNWKRFKLLFEKVYPSFFNRLNTLEFKFTKGEKRLMALIKLDMENTEIADALGISAESVSKSKFRLKKKLNQTSTLEEFVHKI